MRHALARQICADYKDEEGTLRVVTLSPALETELNDAVQKAEPGRYIPVDPARSDAIAQSAAKALQPMVRAGYEGIVLTSAQVRRYFRRIAESRTPKVIVMSYNEIDPAVKLNSEGTVAL